MFQPQRHEKILEMLEKNKSVKTIELSKLFQTSRQTIHNDIEQLDSLGKLIKVHGGAVQQPASIEPSATLRKTQYIEEKKLIGEIAAGFVEEGDTVFLDMGTTVLEMVPFLKEYNQLTVITNSLTAAYKLSDCENIRVILFGGAVRSKEQSVSGPETVNMAKQYYADKSFIGAGGVSAEAGYTDYHLDEAEIRKIMIDHSSQAFSLIDHSKIDVIATTQFAQLNEIGTLITDRLTSKKLRERLTESNVNYYDSSILAVPKLH